MPLIARLHDPASHPGEICTSSERSPVEGILAARIGDIFCCEIHGPNPIVTGATHSYCEDKLYAFDGSVCECGAVIQATAQRSYVE